jgi:hypothetical protein
MGFHGINMDQVDFMGKSRVLIGLFIGLLIGFHQITMVVSTHPEMEG